MSPGKMIFAVLELWLSPLQWVLGVFRSFSFSFRTPYLHQTADSVIHSQYDLMYDWELEHLISLLLALWIVECGVLWSDCRRSLNLNRCISFTRQSVANRSLCANWIRWVESWAESVHWKKWKTRHTSFSATKCLDDLFLVFRRRSSVYSVLVFRDGKSGV